MRPRSAVRRPIGLGLSLLLTATTLGALGATAASSSAAVAPTAAQPVTVARAVAPNPPTPGTFTGLGFDQCEAPSQSAMNAWTRSSPFRAVGIYISGDSRFCQAQTNLTPTWVSNQLSAGWHLLPIHLGPQAACTDRDRYLKQVRIDASTGGDYSRARAQGAGEANKAVAAASRLGLVPGSAIFYDIEAWNTSKSTACNVSALKFLGAFTDQLHTHGYRSGVYSSGASGIRLLDNQRVTPGNTIAMPDLLWIADWNGKANVNSSYVRSDGWMPSSRVHQYQGGHNETWGGVTINIDRNYLQLSGPTAAPAPKPKPQPAAGKCARGVVDRADYPFAGPRRNRFMIRPMQCALRQAGFYQRRVTGKWKTSRYAVRRFQASVGHKKQNRFTRADWDSVLGQIR